MRMAEDLQLKLKRIRNWLAVNSLDSVLLESQSSIAWLTGGRTFIGFASETACARILISRDNLFLITNNIEAERLIAEEISSDQFKLCTFNWYESDAEERLVKSLVTPGQIVARECDWADELRKLRYPLTELEQERYAQLGLDTARVIEHVCEDIRLGETEFSAASRLAMRCMERGMEPVLTLVGSDERSFIYRHPLPTTKKIDKHAILALGARRHGLVCSVSRMVHFGALPDAMRRRHQAVAHVDAAFIHGTRPGADMDALFQEAQRIYAHYGYSDEWRNHHQGGMTGYASREYKAAPRGRQVVHVYEAFSWNPTLPGVKSEDTILVEPSINKILSRTGAFPEVQVDVGGTSMSRPDILIRHS